jgi:hypothetical protein
VFHFPVLDLGVTQVRRSLNGVALFTRDLRQHVERRGLDHSEPELPSRRQRLLRQCSRMIEISSLEFMIPERTEGPRCQDAIPDH